MRLFPILLLSIFSVIAGLFSTSCADIDFSTNPSHVLSFSTDTMSFDTIFTQIGSSTRELKVYNRNKQALKIQSIRLGNAQVSGFYINVDGMKGTAFQDVELLGNDSLSIFVEANINPQSSNSPILVLDSIIFITNGKTQDVKLSAYGQDIDILHGRILTADTTLTGIKPILIYDSLVVAPNVTLTMNEGVTLHFHNKARMRVKGRLIANGTMERQVTLRGDRTDRLFPNLPYDYLAGQWDGLSFDKDSYENVLNYVSFRGSSQGIQLDSSEYSKRKITLSNSIIHNSSGNLFSAVNCNIVAWNCQFSNAGGAVLYLQGGIYEFSHCTFANYYSFDIIWSPILVLCNYEMINSAIIPYPIEKADFNNCIIYGNANDIDLIRPKDAEVDLQHKFNHCLLKSNGEDDANFINTLWKSNPLFLETGKNYLYDFRLNPKSVARKTGDPQIANRYPFDILGNPRNNNEAPDLGAYQCMDEDTDSDQ